MNFVRIDRAHACDACRLIATLTTMVVVIIALETRDTSIFLFLLREASVVVLLRSGVDLPQIVPRDVLSRGFL